MAQNKSGPCLGEFLIVDEDLQRLIDLNLPRAAERHNIDLEGIPLKFKKNVHRRGEFCKQIDGTRKRYDTQYRQLWLFLAQRGAWDSMLLLLFPNRVERKSTLCPAMDLRELCNFVRYKMNPKGMALKDGNNDDCDQLTDVFGAHMACAGGWNSDKTMDMFGTAISSVHKVHGHDEAYKPSCPYCQRDSYTRKHSCPFHEGTWGSLAFRRGNPSLTDDFTKNKNALADPNYQARVATQIDPEDVRAIRRAMLDGVPTLAGLKFFVMVMTSIKLFLRADEIISLAVKDIPSSLFYRVAGKVHAVGLSVTGECDQGQLKWFLLFLDDVFPDICPLRHFLIYIYHSGIKDGHCFPTDKDLHNETVGTDGIYMQHESYQTLLRGVKTIARLGVFNYNKESDFRATIHIFRKGAYYFRIIASKTDEIDWVSLRYDARHVNESDMFIYVRDAATLRQTIDFERQPDMRVSDNRKVRFETRCAAEKIFGKASDATDLSLFQLAREYVLSLAVGPNPSLRAALDAALKPANLSFEQRKSDFVNSLSRRQILEYSHIMDMYTRQRMMELKEQQRLFEEQQSTAAEETDSTKKRKSKSAADATTKKAKIDLVFEDIDRNAVKNLPTIAEKLEAYKKLQPRVPQELSALTSGAKKWVLKSLRPALGCLCNHHNNNIDSYVEAWKSSPVGWKMLHPCTGKTDVQCVAITNS